MSGTAAESPNAPRPQDPLTRQVADALARTGANYDREGSGPGSRFEGRLLEDVQAELAVRMVLQAQPLSQLRWAPYQEFGITDPAEADPEPPDFPFTVGSVGYQGNDVTVYWKAVTAGGEAQ
jgi:hypothetical protein